MDDLPQRLRAKANDLLDPKGETMAQWDKIRGVLLSKHSSSRSDLPRLMFEGLLEDFAELMVEAAEALDPSTLHNIRNQRS